MKYALLTLTLFLSVPVASSAATKLMQDRINSMNWDGDSYTVHFNTFQKPIKISGSNAVIPCLMNAKRSSMDVLVTIDSDIPMVKSCKLYSQSQPATKTIQSQEQKPR